MPVNKSWLTNICAASLIGISFTTPVYREQILNMGLYALSGSVTNLLAIHMLFEKVPGLYGSGIIPNKFEAFKTGIREMIMTQFFTKENIDRFFAEQAHSHNIDLKPLVDSLDYSLLFEKLKSAVLESPLGSMLAMFGGPETLDSLKDPITVKVKDAIFEITSDDSFQEQLGSILSNSLHMDQLIVKVEHIVYARLEELSPEMVKDIIQSMIREHLGWLVVWGGLFGALIGLIASFMP